MKIIINTEDVRQHFGFPNNAEIEFEGGTIGGERNPSCVLSKSLMKIPPMVFQYLRERKKIEAIKEWRLWFGSNLLESKEAVEAISLRVFGWR